MKTNSWLGVGILLTLGLNSHSAPTAPRLGRVAAAPAVMQAASPASTIEFSVYLPLRNGKQLDSLLADLHDKSSPKYQQWLQPSDFLQRFGPRPADLAALRAALTARGFTVVQSNAHGMHVRGPASAASNAFGVAIHSRTQNGRTHFMAKTELQIPSELAALNVRILGLAAVPERQVHARVTGQLDKIVDNRYGVTGPYWFDDLKQAYDYPAYGAKTNGAGVHVAVLMSDLIFPDDVGAAFTHEKFTAITGLAAPNVTTVTIDGGGVLDGPGSFEASLDVQQVLGGAPASNVTLVSIPDLSDQSIVDGYTYIVDRNSFDIVNSSFGGCELEYTAAYNGGTDYTSILQTYHEIFAQGNAQGITFVASSGDEGGLICPSVDYGTPGAAPTFVAGVSTPADDPNVTSVGGGNLITVATAGILDSTYVRESAFADPEVPYDIYGLGQNVSGGVWAAGGGVSSVFAKPLYQLLAKTGSSRWRTEPDIGMQVGGCPGSAISCDPDDSAAVVAYGVGLGGGYYGVIGTSVSSPEFVGALALFEQQFGKHHRQGNINYFLYAAGALQTLAGGVHAPASFQFYRRNIPGNDGLWDASYPSYNYNYIYGNGSPDVRKLFGLKGFPAAGLPQTPSNP
ncbi:MAG: protease pro-enzyme activation domain-containing protein [Gammaproteobacteria bacterium]